MGEYNLTEKLAKQEADAINKTVKAESITEKLDLDIEVDLAPVKTRAKR